MIRFLKTGEIWPRITHLAKKSAKAMVAVAYFGQEASQMLPLRSGSVLVVDCHPRSVKAGRTCPSDLLRLIRKNVEVHSCSNLHAKIFVFGGRAIIGSANASKLSKNYLLEGAVETTDKLVVAGCRELIQRLRGDQITPKYAQMLCKIWNPPKIFGEHQTVVARFHPLWVVPLIRLDWDEVDSDKDRHAEPIAKTKLTSRRRFVLEKFRWEGDNPFLRNVKRGHQIIQAMEGGSSHQLYRPSRVIHLKKYRKGSAPHLIVYLETPRVKPTWRMEHTVRTILGPLEKKFVLKQAARRIRDPRLAHALFQLWPGGESE